jgi:tetratricopeptide (TPR) repeat protein
VSTDELIFERGKAWIPVEVTERTGGFMEAWKEGAREWRMHASSGQVGFYPMHEAWELYEPVGLPTEASEIKPLSQKQIVVAYLKQMQRYIDKEIYPQVAKLEDEIGKTGGSPKARNKLGILYAKYGKQDKAQAEFKRIVQKAEYVPALVNLGNIAYLNREWDEALDYYERAGRQSPSNAVILVNIGRVHHELENYGSAKRAYSKVKQLDSKLADRYAYLEMKGEEGVRAAEMNSERGIVEWIEE